MACQLFFVYGDPGDGGSTNTNCSDPSDITLTHRWYQANAQAKMKFYVVLKVFSGYSTVPCQPDSWHQYAPASRSGSHGTHSAYVSPGFWKDSSGEVVRLAHDLTAFQNAVSGMVSANVKWKLTETWNEWGEGSSVEPGNQTLIDGTGKEVLDPNGAPFGNAYIQALADRLPALEAGTGRVAVTPKAGSSNKLAFVKSVLTKLAYVMKRTFAVVRTSIASLGRNTLAYFTSTPKAEAAVTDTNFTFAAGGDHGKNSNADASLSKLNTLSPTPSFYLALGDMDYDETTSDAAWCDYVKAGIPNLGGANFPFELVSGNHEEGSATVPGPDGYIMNHAACLPDKLGSTGAYAREYYFDYGRTTSGGSTPLMRVIIVAAALNIDGVSYSYTFDSNGNPTNTHATWLRDAVDNARAQGIPWIVVGMHKVCITTGEKSCEIGTSMMNFLIRKKS